MLGRLDRGDWPFRKTVSCYLSPEHSLKHAKTHSARLYTFDEHRREGGLPWRHPLY